MPTQVALLSKGMGLVCVFELSGNSEIEEKGTSRRTAYRRIDEAEQTGLIKFCKGKNVYIVS
jgi:hypothetical protein